MGLIIDENETEGKCFGGKNCTKYIEKTNWVYLCDMTSEDTDDKWI